MFKLLKLFLVALIAISIVTQAVSVQAESAPTPDPFRAIAKIRTFTQDHEYDMVDLGYGSGIIINSSGLLLTNNHVIEVKSDFDSSELEASYMVCLPLNMIDEPDCSYTAKLISKNEKLDIALLQIESISGLSSLTSFPYLELSQVDTTNINDPVTAIGYPEIGGASVTTTQGIISGKTEKYEKKWIKTDAVISFGSSGGAALNSSNKVIGITSAGHSDLLGSLGYIINIASVNEWVIANQNKERKNSSLLGRLRIFAAKEKAIKQSSVFENPNPSFTITKPRDWEFTRRGENQLYITNPGDDLGGDIYLFVSKLPYLVDDNTIVQQLKRNSLLAFDYSLFKIHENARVKIGNVYGRRIRYTDSDGQNTLYAVPFRNYILFIQMGYGEEDKDKAIIESIIQTINVKKDTSIFKEEKAYTHTDPYFSFTVDKDWVVLKKNEKDHPLVVLNKKNKDIFITVDVSRTDDTTKRMNQDELLKHFKELIESANKISGNIDLKMDYTETNAHYNVNSNFKDTIKGLTTLRTKGNNKIIGYEYGYSKKLNDKYILNVSLYNTNPDIKTLTNYRLEFNRLLKGFSLKAPPVKKN